MEKKRYIISCNGLFVGLFNWGRTYKYSLKPCIIKETPERAEIIAKAFKGTLTEV